MSGGKLDRFLCLPGSRVRVAPAWNLVRGGGCSKNQRLFVPRLIFLSRCRAVTWQW